MAFANKSRRIGFAVLAVAATAVLVWFGAGMFPLWPLMWFAPLPLLLFANRGSWRGTALVAFGAWLIGSLNLWRYLHTTLQAPFLLSAGILVPRALVFMLAVLLYRALLRRGAWGSALVAFPATWVSFEYVFNLASVHGTAGSLSYSQLNCLPFLQLASVTGPWGMSFLLLLFSSTLAIAMHLLPAQPKPAMRILGMGLGAIVLALVFGAVRLSLPQPGPRVKVGLIASDLAANTDIADEGPETTRLLSDYAAPAQALAAQGAQIIVLPEKLGVVVSRRAAATDALLQSLADKTGAKIIVGLVFVNPPFAYNQARIYTPRAPLETYDKHHMLPPFESRLKPGTTLTFLPATRGKLGVAICKDMDFTQLSRRYGEMGTGLILAPAWDFTVDRAWHGHIAIMRGVEDGFSIARAAKLGLLTVSDNRGRILAEKRSNSAPFATLIADVPATHETTLYLLLGDWFAWLTLAIFAFALLRLVQLAFFNRQPAH
jgi:apolipoprotein N-acyltransferase